MEVRKNASSGTYNRAEIYVRRKKLIVGYIKEVWTLETTFKAVQWVLILICILLNEEDERLDKIFSRRSRIFTISVYYLYIFVLSLQLLIEILNRRIPNKLETALICAGTVLLGATFGVTITMWVTLYRLLQYSSHYKYFGLLFQSLFSLASAIVLLLNLVYNLNVGIEE